MNLAIIKSFNFISLLVFIIVSFINKKSKLIKVCLCVIGKQENLYAKEYVAHYKKLGYKSYFYL
jgi:hypothetical protein